jgi:hypothetical protein
MEKNEKFFVHKPEHSKSSRNFANLDDCIKDLESNYTNPGHPIAFSGIQSIYNYYNGKLSYEQIKNVLQNFENYTLHREYHQLRRNPSFSHFKGYQWQMDLVDIQPLAEYNDGIRYILTVIDTFTRYAFCRLIENKTGSVVLKAFESILTEANRKPLTIVLDGGSEFRNKMFQEFCKKNKINLFAPDTSTHGAYIERFNRTLQDLTYKYMTEKNTYRFKDIFQDLVKTYNLRKHRMIGFTPYEAETNNDTHLQIRLNLSKYHNKIKPKSPIFKIGDTVRIAKLKGKFSRGYKERTNREYFKVYKVSLIHNIPLYYLESYNGKEKIRGGFYDFELTKVGTDVFQVEKVIKTRKLPNGEIELFVKWRDFDNSYNEWIKQTDVTRTY